MLKIVAFGDSLTRGIIKGVVPSHLTWTFILERILNFWLDEEVIVINARVGGNTTVNALKRIDRDVIMHKPDIVLIMFGMYDCMKIHLEKFRRNLTKIISVLRKQNIQPILITPNPISKNYVKVASFKEFIIRSVKLRKYVNVIKEVALEKDVPLIDINRLFTDNPVLRDFIFDGIHPDSVAQSSMANFIAKHLLDYLGVTNFPYVELIGFTKVYEDGRHNAFTDIIEWNGKYYIAFRNASCHFDPKKSDGKIFLFKSHDLMSWSKISELHTEGWDNRDPKLYVFNNRLYLFTQSWSPTEKIHKTFMFYTEDSVHWSDPVDCGEYVYWRPHYFAGYTYVAAYKADWRRKEKFEVHLLRSKDCYKWELVSIISKEDFVNETDLIFLDNKVLAFTRRERENTLLFESEYPFTKWNKKELNVIVQSPAVIKLSSKIFLAGRYVDKERSLSKTALFILDNDKLRLIYELPSGGDNAYPGMIRINEDIIALSYYSSHEAIKENMSNIYLALLLIKYS